MWRGLGVGSASWWAMGGQMPWPRAAAGDSRVLHSSPPGLYSAPKAMQTCLACANMGSSLRSVDGLLGRKMWSTAGSASCSLWVGGGGGGRLAG